MIGIGIFLVLFHVWKIWSQRRRQWHEAWWWPRKRLATAVSGSMANYPKIPELVTVHPGCACIMLYGTWFWFHSEMIGERTGWYQIIEAVVSRSVESVIASRLPTFSWPNNSEVLFEVWAWHLGYFLLCDLREGWISMGVGITITLLVARCMIRARVIDPEISPFSKASTGKSGISSDVKRFHIPTCCRSQPEGGHITCKRGVLGRKKCFIPRFYN